MKRSAAARACLAFALLLPGATVRAEPDDVQQAWLEAVSVAPSWDNVREGRGWVAGQRPERRAWSGVHTVRLDPGAEVTVRLPAGEVLRLAAPEGPVDSAGLEAAWSNGSGLFAALAPEPAGDGRSLVVRPPRHAETLVRIRRAADAARPTELALYVSHDPNREVVTSYRETVQPVSAGSRHRLDEGEASRDFWLADRDHPFELDYDGPVRLRIDSRLLFPAEDGPQAASYRVHAYRDGKLLREIDLATVLETRKDVAADGCARPVGRAADGYLDLPQGPGRLSLRVHEPMLLRVLAARRPSDYLLAANAPLDEPHSSRPASVVYQDAVRIARDNARPQGGSGAVRSIEALAQGHPAQARDQALASRRRLLHTFFRDLMPEQGTADRAPLFAWFGTRRLAEDAPDLFLPAGYLQGLAADLASGVFHEVPRGRAQAYTFHVPERLPAGELRVAVDLAGVAEAQGLYLQLDDASPRRLQLDTQRPVRDGELRPNSASLALSLSQQGVGGRAGTLSGAFGARRATAPLLDVAFVEIPLEGPVERVRLWRDEGASGPLRAALAYRTSGWFRLSESGYLGLLKALGETRVRELLHGSIAGLGRGDPSAEPDPAAAIDGDERELHNQWLPLLRALRARHAAFAAGVAEPAEAVSSATADPAAAAQIRKRAESAESAGDFLAALRHWSAMLGPADVTQRLDARSGQIRALQALGSGFLAQQLLRQDLLYAAEPAQRELAVRLLLGLAEAEQDADAILSVLVVAAVHDPSPHRLQALAAALAADGQDRFALQLLLAIPARQRSASLVIESAYALRWWELFDATVDELEEPEARALWRGHRSQFRGDFDAALRYWEEAGPPGRALAARLAAGLGIRAALESQRNDDRRRALLDWEQWQGSDPGPEVWRDAGHAITAHAGTRTVVSIAHGEYDDLFLATPGTPLRLAVYGPTRLRLGIRPLHEQAGGEAIDDWIGIGSGEGLRRHPVIDNRVSPGWLPAADARWRPGQAVELVQAVPAGYHEFTVAAARHDLLITVAAAEPRLPLTVLPRLSPYTARYVLSGAGPVPPSPETFDVSVVSGCGVQPAIAVAPPPPTPGGAPSAAWFEGLEAQRAERATSVVEPASARPPIERLADLLWAAEQAPERHAALLAEAEQLVETKPPVPGADAMLRRLRRSATWELVRSVQESAGVRLVEFKGWQPESPELQVRKAVMGLEAVDEQWISGHDARALSLYNLQPVVVGVRLSLLETALQPARPMSVLVSWDGRRPRKVELDAGTPERYLEQRVGTGYHVLRLRIVEPLANQFLRIRLEERRGASRRPIAEPVQRSYMLATREQPLVLMARGPTRLRIDEWRDGRTLVSYRTVPAGWQRVEIAVEKGREEALLRVFRRTLEPGQPTTALRESAYRPEPLQASQWPLVPPIDRPEAALAALPSGRRPGSGTWSLDFGYTDRLVVDDEPQSAGASERFTALGASYRESSAQDDTYWQADGALRLRENGDPTLALGGLVSVRAPDWPVDLDVSGALFLQHVTASGGLESATALRARVSRERQLGEKLSHRPALTLFQRWLSLDALPPRSPEDVDRDIFTRYKRDHSRGLRAGDRIQYRPWLDTVVYAGAELVTNDDLNLFSPDHLSLSLGVRQLVGDLDLELGYRRHGYFADDDRLRDSDTQRLRLDAFFGRWLSPRRGLHAAVTLEYDFDLDDVALGLSLSLDLADRRYYRDLAPGEVDFRPLRQRRTLERHVREGWQ